ncbi:sugar transferase [Jatrophihabitans endophyticus]|uniref:sugar transferase n=1 Tax=Jatrophihabitans endophyticus TaxID=1206085 RepID=UPI0019D9B59B|nr:sugar transferase [Jatrophihabitans endophyticus]MBE7189343.1 sugar transferase [Jatrophihabitans endophyticus]
MTQTRALSSVDPEIAALDAAVARSGPTHQPLWTVQYRLVLLTLDLCAIIIATVVGFELRFGVLAGGLQSTDYLIIGLGIAVGWTVALQYYGGYEIRHIASGPEELKRVLRASAVTLSLLAVGCYVTKTPVARGFVIGVIPLGALLIIAERSAVRRYATARRQRGSWAYRILAVGTSDSVLHLAEITERAKAAGLKIVGACAEDAVVGSELFPGVPVIGGVLDAAQCAGEVDADVVAVTGSGLGPRAVRELGWALEGTNRGLVMAPALTEIAGSRVHVSPVEGLPLVWLDQPALGRIPGVVKRALDIVVAATVLVLIAPVLAATAIAIKTTSRGPVFFRQHRLGAGGGEFSILKFRSMYVGADERRAEILELNEQDGGGVLFKIREDPRVTPVGRWIRKLSIDELPQLVHVLSGTMSLVGPRPLAAVDSTYTGAARRRLLVKPGMTGLWQISGRSQTTWDDAVRMDLYYVENWSLGLDMSILFRTIFAVLGRRGAF